MVVPRHALVPGTFRNSAAVIANRVSGFDPVVIEVPGDPVVVQGVACLAVQGVLDPPPRLGLAALVAELLRLGVVPVHVCWIHSSARLTSRIDARISLTASYNTPRAGWEPELLCALDRAARLAPL
ncbi:hypothetical protein ACFWM0_03200 [Streptomyces sp. NPDC058405]|uniref:hypothetical protein n=1 Tax=Streptomyces sp. NPDC058405 TaxID=3346482 RepID=UPI00364CC250